MSAKRLYERNKTKDIELLRRLQSRVKVASIAVLSDPSVALEMQKQFGCSSIVLTQLAACKDSSDLCVSITNLRETGSCPSDLTAAAVMQMIIDRAIDSRQWMIDR